MKVLVYNSKCGCGKSTIAREVLAALLGPDTKLIEIDEFNRTQQAYSEQLEVVQVTQKNIDELFIHINDGTENVIIDVGIDNHLNTLNFIIESGTIDDIDVVIIPVGQGRSDHQNAIKTHKAMQKHCDKIMFALQVNDDEDFQDQHQVLFENIDKLGIGSELNESDYFSIPMSNEFPTAQRNKKTIHSQANGDDFKSIALKCRDDGNIEEYRELMKKELTKRASQKMIQNHLQPALQKIINKVNDE